MQKTYTYICHIIVRFHAPLCQFASMTSFPKRNCAESCLDFFVLELVHKYTSEESNAKAIATLESIGVRVGKQLAERSFSEPQLTSKTCY